MASIEYYINESNWQESNTIYVYKDSTSLSIIPYWNTVRVLANRPSTCFSLEDEGVMGLNTYHSWKRMDEAWYIKAYGLVDRVFNEFGTYRLLKNHHYYSSVLGEYITEYGAYITIIVKGLATAEVQLISDGTVWRDMVEQIYVESAGSHASTITLPTGTPTKSGYTFRGWMDTEAPHTVWSPGTTLYFNFNTGYTPVHKFTAVWTEDNTTNVYAKVSGSWKRAQKIYAKQSGSWNEVKSLYGKTGGAWKKSQ